MDNLKQIIFILIVSVVLGGVFYWFQWRPAKIIKDCERSARITESWGDVDYKTAYRGCLRYFGIDK